MNRFGFVRAPTNNLVKTYSGSENGTLSDQEDPDRVQRHAAPPTVLWYTTANRRDDEMLACARKFPGVMFCAISIDKGISFPATKNPTIVEISEKGVTPF